MNNIVNQTNNSFVIEKTTNSITGIYISRITFQTKRMLQAFFLGTGEFAAIIMLAGTFRYWLRDILASGQVLKAMIPTFRIITQDEQYHNDNKYHNNKIIHGYWIIFILMFAIISAIAILSICKLFHIHDEITFYIILMYTISSVISIIASCNLGILNLKGYFLFPSMYLACAAIISIIIFLLNKIFLFESNSLIKILSYGTIISAILQVILIFLLLKISNTLPKFNFNLKLFYNTIKTNIFKYMTPGLISTGITKSNLLFSRLATYYNLGTSIFVELISAQSILNFANSIPSALGFTSIVPMSQKILNNNYINSFNVHKFALRQNYFTTIPIIIYIIAFKFNIVNALIGVGAFNINAVKATSYVLLLFAFNTPFNGKLTLLRTLLYGIGEAKSVAIVNTIIEICIKFPLIIINFILFEYYYALIGLAIIFFITIILKIIIYEIILIKNYKQYRNINSIKTYGINIIITKSLLTACIAITAILLLDKIVTHKLELIINYLNPIEYLNFKLIKITIFIISLIIGIIITYKIKLFNNIIIKILISILFVLSIYLILDIYTSNRWNKLINLIKLIFYMITYTALYLSLNKLFKSNDQKEFIKIIFKNIFSKKKLSLNS